MTQPQSLVTDLDVSVLREGEGVVGLDCNGLTPSELVDLYSKIQSEGS